MESRTRHVVWSVAVLLIAGLLAWFVLSTHHADSRYAVKLGLDLAGGTELIYKADTSAIATDKEGALSSLREVIERRVNLFGVAEPLVQLEKSSAVAGAQEDRLLVELPGVTDVKAAVDAIGATPVLEFKLLQPAKENENGTASSTYLDTGLTGRYLKSAELQFGQGAGGAVGSAPIIVLHFNEEGGDLFEAITTEHVGDTLAIFLDGVSISEPTIQEPIAGGDATITGTFTAVEAKETVRDLNFGALPVPIELVSSNSIGPTLGADAFQAGLKASVIGFILVALFMILWYRLPGLVASVALVIYILMTIALIKFIPVTLTASGIAALILSIGMAVDANVLIFERMKEELRQGKAPHDAVAIGFKRAWPAIRDGHFTMIISSIILFWMGTSIVQGFALVFGLGVICSLITAVSITRVFLLAILPFEATPAWRRFLEAGFGKRKKGDTTPTNPN
ncbi:MAG: preprotein translocase subunit SecD [Candidatus Parcubacteria bacterium]|jgi:protein-export membrane protein SecD|nr:preprotein translocase subunit SecD [Candidatus Parcubacteria bacterium]